MSEFDIVVPRRERPDTPPDRGSWRTGLLLILAVLLLLPPAAVLAMRWLPPPTSAFMLQSEVKPVTYRWVPAAQIPDAARKAAVAAEDQKFYSHFGFDFEAIGKALEHNEKSRRKRGASTISQQVAKNLFLWPGRSWLRKGVEVTFTVLLELLWPKERILEVYLNIAEFGPGIYGVEAAAQRFFGKPAAQLSPGEAARLVAVLPNPRRWRADRPGPYVQSRTQAILRLMGYGPPPTADDEALAASPGEDALEEAGEDAPPEMGEGAAATPPADEPAPVGDAAPGIDTAPLDDAPEFEPDAESAEPATAETPTAEEPAPEQPTTEPPAAEEPAAEETPAEQPATEP